MTSRPHHRLTVWRDAMRLVRQIYDHTATLPAEERFGLQSQMRRAVVSIPSNIAEGAARGSTADFIRMLRIARGSVAELETQLALCDDLYELPPPEPLEAAVDDIYRKLNALIRSLIQKAEKP